MEKPPLRPFAKNLKKWRLKRGMTITTLGFKTDIHPASISNYELDTQQPPVEKFILLAQVLVVSLDVLAGVKSDELSTGGGVKQAQWD